MPRGGKQVPPGFFSRINRVMGKVVAAKGLPNMDAYSKSDPYCVIKGIRSNNHLTNIYITKVQVNTTTPEWNEEFDFMIPDSWGLVELVGLKAMIYDADELSINFLGGEDFLGGCDVDISNMVNGRMMSHDLELGGVNVLKAKGKKPRLTLVITAYREIVPKPAVPHVQLMSSLKEVLFIREVVGMIHKVKNLKVKDILARKGEPQCIVRLVYVNGEVKEIHRCQISMDERTEDGAFRARFGFMDQPVLLIFDLFQSENLNICESDGEHLGTAVVPLMNCLPPEPRKKKIILQGETQLHEKRLGKEGDARKSIATRHSKATVEEIEAVEDRKTASQRLGEALHTLRKEVFSSAPPMSSRPLLQVEVRARTKKEDMPFIDQFGKYVDVADNEDVEGVLSLPDWKRTLYPLPKALLAEENGGVVPRGQLFSDERISFIYGFVFGASGLAPADANGSSDPYTIVEAVSRVGEKIFIHRTRSITAKLNPEWGEAFYFRVPDDFEANRIVFSIFDSDSNAASQLLGVSSQAEDDFLGRANLDLSYLCSGEAINEDVPITGSAVKSGEKLTTGFRRTPIISVEVRCERHLKPIFAEVSQDGFQAIPRRKHNLSRQPFAERAMMDFSQEMPIVEEVEQMAAEVLEFTSTRQLLTAGREAAGNINWFEIPDDGRKEEEEAGNDEDDEEKQKREAQALKEEFEKMKIKKNKVYELPHGIDFTIRHGRFKAKSLPILKTKFGTPAHIFAQSSQKVKSDPGEEVAKSGVNVRFSETAGTQLQSSVRSMQHKPDPEDLLSRSGRPHTSPAKVFDGPNRVPLKLEPL
mmetsp:Transcript_23555/g.42511  ORF Transcript_23555/g.42511 Transcript_23555/m.42511 type:complete len:814 (+) Transcript_23555:144-2585(+)|eukprot:CAMPEP_0197670986 /NCGR_PEP_ID=MMETSP1338-20131121/75751_1 /TAXON_ID=43686 ORGANISM="Pelagodinium beii, Strain RCC1491" /NCGR_SAMPLE_ID=MMETSP1338 /ASSEMBLY_ACC=CAM_ASM_000754 /LENGTH=813 /DNA_ID=CAMNT_0043250807 /DNA_START=56 /DNA_END=2497 /DNA_ORIENTATION=-